MLINAPRGTKDILPDQVSNWLAIENKMREVCARYGYDEIRTPIFEHTELFQRGIGEGTDVVDKEMYTFVDRGNRSITLRPENTASVIRAYLQNKLYSASTLVKLFYMGSMFRYDRPQAGRLREFHQFGVEALGEANPAVDAEVILLALEMLREFGLEGLTLKLNTVGCPKCRPVYRQKLTHYFSDKLDELCGDCRRRYEKNPLRILDCKVDGGKEFVEDAPKIEDCLCDECRDHFKKVQALLKAAGVEYELDARLVRGLDYYTKTAFEIRCDDLGAQAAIAGGGRYVDAGHRVRVGDRTVIAGAREAGQVADGRARDRRVCGVDRRGLVCVRTAVDIETGGLDGVEGFRSTEHEGADEAGGEIGSEVCVDRRRERGQ